MRRERRQKDRKKWDADSNRYALKLPQKPKPHCLILFRHGGFFFSGWCRSIDVNSALEHRICRRRYGRPTLNARRRGHFHRAATVQLVPNSLA
jgi:hypothetical protein